MAVTSAFVAPASPGSATVHVKDRLFRLAGALLSLLAAGVAGIPEARADSWPAEVHALYRIELAGFDVGSFEMRATTKGTHYTVAGEARLSALLGAFRWTGLTRSAGVLGGAGPRPSGYTFDFNGTAKSGAVKLGFSGDQVANIAVSPPQPADPDAVPVRAPHLKGVLDPLSAVVALSRPTSGDPCQRRLPIFDGKQRFDLVLGYLRQERIPGLRGSLEPGVGIVCRVRFVPIAGHRNNGEMQALAQNSGIEISLRPVPGAGLNVPYQIRIPMVAGKVVLTSQHVNILTRGNEQIALSD